jgi:hypothetical protein
MNAFLRIAVWLIAYVLLAGSLVAEPLPRSVLIIDQLEPGIPFFDGFLAAFRSTVNASSVVPVSYYPEFLDFGRYSGPEQRSMRGGPSLTGRPGHRRRAEASGSPNFSRASENRNSGIGSGAQPAPDLCPCTSRAATSWRIMTLRS